MVLGADEKVFTAACVQMRSGIDRQANIAAAEALIADAASQGADFIATPEMTSLLDRNPKRFFADLPSEDAAPELAAFSAAALRHSVWLLVGSVPIRVGERHAANRSYLFSPSGDVAVHYDKIHMFDVVLPDGESWRESKIYQAGAKAVAPQTPFAHLGLSICYDLRFAGLYRALAQQGAEVFCIPAAFTKQTGKAHWATLLRARAIENGAFVIAPAQGGLHEDGRETYGHSMIISPWGDVLAEAQHDAPGVILAQVNLARAHEARAAIPNLALEQRYKVINLKV